MNARIINWNPATPDVMRLADWLTAHEATAEEVSMLITDMGLGRREVAANFPKTLIARACRTPQRWANLATALDLIR